MSKSVYGSLSQEQQIEAAKALVEIGNHTWIDLLPRERDEYQKSAFIAGVAYGVSQFIQWEREHA